MLSRGKAIRSALQQNGSLSPKSSQCYVNVKLIKTYAAVSESQVSCPYCHKIFEQEKSLIRHMRTPGNCHGIEETPSEPVDTPSLECNICVTVFSRKCSLIKHQNRGSCSQVKFNRYSCSNNVDEAVKNPETKIVDVDNNEVYSTSYSPNSPANTNPPLSSFPLVEDDLLVETIYDSYDRLVGHAHAEHDEPEDTSRFGTGIDATVQTENLLPQCDDDLDSKDFQTLQCNVCQIYFKNKKSLKQHNCPISRTKNDIDFPEAKVLRVLSSEESIRTKNALAYLSIRNKVKVCLNTCVALPGVFPWFHLRPHQDIPILREFGLVGEEAYKDMTNAVADDTLILTTTYIIKKGDYSYIIREPLTIPSDKRKTLHLNISPVENNLMISLKINTKGPRSARSFAHRQNIPSLARKNNLNQVLLDV